MLHSFNKHNREFDEILRLNGYPEDAMDISKHPPNRPRDPQSQRTEWLPVHLLPIGPGNHKNLPERKPPSTHRSQIPHSETNPRTAHQRADMQQDKLPHLKHQSVPTQKYSLPTHVQGFRKGLHWKHNTIPTRLRERTFDQRQFVREKTPHNVPSQHPKH